MEWTLIRIAASAVIPSEVVRPSLSLVEEARKHQKDQNNDEMHRECHYFDQDKEVYNVLNLKKMIAQL